MDDGLFIKNWERLDAFTKKAFKDFARHPTEQNACYATGYIAALADRGLLTDPGYWLAVVGRMRDSERVREAVLASLV